MFTTHRLVPDRSTLAVLLGAAFALLACAPAHAAPTLSTDFTDSFVAGGIDRPTDLAFTPDGRMLQSLASGDYNPNPAGADLTEIAKLRLTDARCCRSSACASATRAPTAFAAIQTTGSSPRKASSPNKADRFGQHDSRRGGLRRLITIPISHFCEKARWALERSALPYDEERHIQGVHRVAARRAGGGSTVPVLVAPDGVFAESEQILAYADRSLPEPLRLFPADPELRHEVEQLSRSFDEGLGPDGRRLMYARMLEQRRLMLKVNCQGVPAWERRAMTIFWRAIVPWAKRELSITTDSAAADEPRVRSAFDAVAERLADGRRYLCGERFTAADLTFATLSAAVVVPPQYGVSLPQPDILPAPIAGTVRSFRAHPAGEYALKIFREERLRVVRTEEANGALISSVSRR